MALSYFYINMTVCSRLGLSMLVFMSCEEVDG